MFRQCPFADAVIIKLTAGGKSGLRAEPVRLVVVQVSPKDGRTYFLEQQIDQGPHINYEYDKEIHARVSHNRSQDAGSTAAQWEPGPEAGVNGSKKGHDI